MNNTRPNKFKMGVSLHEQMTGFKSSLKHNTVLSESGIDNKFGDVPPNTDSHNLSAYKINFLHTNSVISDSFSYSRSRPMSPDSTTSNFEPILVKSPCLPNRKLQ